MRCVILLLTLWGSVSFAQNRNSIWCFGDSAGIDFSNLLSPNSFQSAGDGDASYASIADSSGNLLFYSYAFVKTARTIILNAAHDTMKNCGLLSADALFSELLILPRKTKQEYFVFHNGFRGFIDSVFYSLVDMSLDSGKGAVTIKNKSYGAYRSGDCLQAVKHGNGRDWWLVNKLSSSNFTTNNRFYVYLIENDSIHNPIIQNFNTATDGDFQKLTFSSNGTKLMMINLLGFMAQYDFDRCSGVISNEQIIFPEQSSGNNRLFWDGAYSPNDSVFYTQTTPYSGFSNQSNLVQYNLFASNIAASADTLDIQYPPVGTGALRLAPDGKIYVTHAYECNAFPTCFPYPDSVRNYVNENLSVINNPNAIGVACNYQPFSFYLGGKRTYYGLPNNPNYELGPLVGSPCDTLSLGIKTPFTAEDGLMVSLFPNPATSIIYIKNKISKFSKASLKISDAIGKTILEKTLNENWDIETVTTQNWSSGLYIVQLSNSYSGKIERLKLSVVK